MSAVKSELNRAASLTLP
jgi:hypothetical protein